MDSSDILSARDGFKSFIIPVNTMSACRAQQLSPGKEAKHRAGRPSPLPCLESGSSHEALCGEEEGNRWKINLISAFRPEPYNVLQVRRIFRESPFISRILNSVFVLMREFTWTQVLTALPELLSSLKVEGENTKAPSPHHSCCLITSMLKME